MQNLFETLEFFKYRAEVLDRIHFAKENGYIETDDIEEFIKASYLRQRDNSCDATASRS